RRRLTVYARSVCGGAKKPKPAAQPAQVKPSRGSASQAERQHSRPGRPRRPGALPGSHFGPIARREHQPPVAASQHVAWPARRPQQRPDDMMRLKLGRLLALALVTLGLTTTVRAQAPDGTVKA